MKGKMSAMMAKGTQVRRKEPPTIKSVRQKTKAGKPVAQISRRVVPAPDTSSVPPPGSVSQDQPSPVPESSMSANGMHLPQQTPVYIVQPLMSATQQAHVPDQTPVYNEQPLMSATQQAIVPDQTPEYYEQLLMSATQQAIVPDQTPVYNEQSLMSATQQAHMHVPDQTPVYNEQPLMSATQQAHVPDQTPVYKEQPLMSATQQAHVHVPDRTPVYNVQPLMSATQQAHLPDQTPVYNVQPLMSATQQAIVPDQTPVYNEQPLISALQQAHKHAPEQTPVYNVQPLMPALQQAHVHNQTSDVQPITPEVQHSEASVLGASISLWLSSLLAEPLPTLTPTSIASTPARPSAFRTTRPDFGGSNLTVTSSFYQLVEGRRVVERDVNRLTRQVEALTRSNIAQTQEIASLKEMGASLVMASYHQAAQVASAPQPPLATERENAEAIIPSHAMLSDDEVRLIHQASNGAMNFAAHLTQRLFPELFTASMIRLHYNYHGGRKDKKQPLSPRRKSAIRTYVIRHFPSMADDNNWRNEGIPKINEMLRRQTRMPAAMEQ
ncbi:zonadhesin-like [Dreissena polymorpha]|uniref:zonadhesin-like n=1 Tax=Dreissena polymorpha TaxID=45954 RepID=UPI002264A9A6|nr:zonadhesin-like [Dreissena polymorpha]XP_052226467.1 zonadhesin-like [Dreissena polymorpha]